MYDDREYRPVAPDIDSLARCYDRGFSHMERNSSRELLKAMEPLFDALSDLALHKASDEAKTIWIAAPRGELSDFGEFEDYEDEYIKTPEDFRNYWLEEYPDDPVWYRLTIGEGPERFPYRSVAVDNTGIANVRLNEEIPDEADYREEPALKLLPLLTKLAKESMEKLREDTYNEWVSTALPYQHRTGVIKRSDEWKAYPEEKERIWGEMDRETYEKFKTLVVTNDEGSIGRIVSFTANDFFNACVLGYQALGYNLDGMTPDQAYLHYADGRDEGLTGTGHGLNEGPGIDFDSPTAWDEWYFGSRGGGHPWEVVPGGNSTHMELYVRNDKDHLGYLHRAGEIDDDEYEEKMKSAGYYFHIAGKHRPEESITFFVALREAGLPVIISDSDEIIARFEGTDYIGIVPHRIIPKYCEGMFPDEYGNVIDFMNVYSDEIGKLEKYITWLPEDEAELV